MWKGGKGVSSCFAAASFLPTRRKAVLKMYAAVAYGDGSHLGPLSFPTALS